MLPENLQQHLVATLNTTITTTERVSGGDINEAVQVRTAGNTYFLKWNRHAAVGMFTAEARGLQLLAEAEALPVPEVLHIHEAAEGVPAYLLLAWLPTGRRSANTMTELGVGLARLHGVQRDQYGLDHDNFIGSLPQRNQQSKNWAEFYAQQRIAVQRDIARELGRLNPERERLVNKLIDAMASWLPDDVPAALLHGDLWSGNVMTLEGGKPALIDPAVYFGHAEVELAFTELFGGFGGDFYDAYWSNSTVDRNDYSARRDLYQLYPLMVHMNLFGGGYIRSVDAILNRYVD